jgi:hypothetical protein
MKWLLPVLTLAFILVLFGGAFFALRPSRGEPAWQIAVKSQTWLKSHPLLCYYLPLAVGFGFFITAVFDIVTEQPIEARITRILLASTYPLASGLLVRFWTWPSR